jgi:hypothetical protein
MSIEDLEKRIECLEQTQNTIIQTQHHIVDCLNNLIAASKNPISNILQIVIGVGYLGAILYILNIVSKI